jgi:hypothetical protein
VTANTETRDVSLTIPAHADYLVLARLALSAVCKLTSLSPEEVADLKLAVTEAAAGYVADGAGEAEERLTLTFRLLDEQLVLELDGSGRPTMEDEQELARAIIEATVDESRYESGQTRLVKYLRPDGQPD